MNTTVEALKNAYVELGGSLTDTYEAIAGGIPVSDYVVIPDVINAIAQIAGTTIELPAVSNTDNGDVLIVSGGKWAKGNAPTELPEVVGTDNGDVLMVVEGAWAKAAPEKELPAVSASDDGSVLTVVDGAWSKAQPSGDDGLEDRVNALENKRVYINPEETVQSTTGQTVNGSKEYIYTATFSEFENPYFVFVDTSADLYMKAYDGSGNIIEEYTGPVEINKTYDAYTPGEILIELYSDLEDVASVDDMKVVSFKYLTFWNKPKTVDEEFSSVESIIQANKTLFDNFVKLVRPYVVNNNDNGVTNSVNISNGINTNQTFNQLVSYITSQVNDTTFFPPVYRYDPYGEIESAGSYTLPFLKYDSTENAVYFGGIEARDPAHPNVEIIKLTSSKSIVTEFMKAL